MFPDRADDPLITAPSPRPVHGAALLHKDNKLAIYSGISYVILFLFACWLVPQFPRGTGVTCTDNGKVIQDAFPGAPWRTSQTVDSKLLLSDSRMRVESHTVKGEDGKLYKDWIWMDVVDQINVMPYVLAPPPTDSSTPYNKYEGGHFRVFRQKKYGLRDESLAVCGGQVEMAKNEPPLHAAKRELEEEMSLMGAHSDWVSLGSYRVNVNRGHGICSCFLVVNALERFRPEEEFHVDELERQSIVRLTVDEMEQAIRTHQFGEIKWQATAVMALYEVKRLIQEEAKRIVTQSSLPPPPPPTSDKSININTSTVETPTPIDGPQPAYKRTPPRKISPYRKPKVPTTSEGPKPA